jgi:hypothetical protein
MRLAYNSSDPTLALVDEDMPPEGDPADRGLALIGALAMGEVFAAASADQARGFYRTVGTRLAAQYPIPPMRDLRELEGAVNAIWAALGLGYAKITLDTQGVLIRHQDAPEVIEGDMHGHWPHAVAALLAGAYDGWLRAMGSPEALVTRVQDQSEAGIEIRHGAPSNA